MAYVHIPYVGNEIQCTGNGITNTVLLVPDPNRQGLPEVPEKHGSLRQNFRRRFSETEVLTVNMNGCEWNNWINDPVR
jgi:hypothetical protein